MKSYLPSRLCLGAALLVLSASLPALARQKQQAPNLRPARPAERPTNRPTPNEGRNRPNQPHLAQWMENHRNLSLAEQQRALQDEPGFRELPRETQQRQLDQLARLNAMSPEQRSRMLDRTEALERLSVPQRQQWNSAVQQLNALPVPRRRLMARAILDLREMPPQQRQQVIDSPAMRGQFSDQERSMLSTLLTVEPYSPNQ